MLTKVEKSTCSTELFKLFVLKLFLYTLNTVTIYSFVENNLKLHVLWSSPTLINVCYMNLCADTSSALLSRCLIGSPVFVSVLLYMTRFKDWGDTQLKLVCVFGSNKHYKSNYWWVISCSYNQFICSFVLSAYIGLQACLLFCLLKTKIILFWPFSLEFYTALLRYNCF